VGEAESSTDRLQARIEAEFQRVLELAKLKGKSEEDSARVAVDLTTEAMTNTADAYADEFANEAAPWVTKITYALYERRPDEAKVIKALAGALTAKVTQAQSSLQAGKHKSKGTVALIRTHLVALEATLTQLLFKRIPD